MKENRSFFKGRAQGIAAIFALAFALLFPTEGRSDLDVKIQNIGGGQTQFDISGSATLPMGAMGVGSPASSVTSFGSSLGVERFPPHSYFSSRGYVGTPQDFLMGSFPTTTATPPVTGTSGYSLTFGTGGTASFIYGSTSPIPAGTMSVSDSFVVPVDFSSYFKEGVFHFGTPGGMAGDGITLWIGSFGPSTTDFEAINAFWGSSMPFGQSIGQLGGTIHQVGLRNVNQRIFRLQGQGMGEVHPCLIDTCFDFGNVEASSDRSYSRYQQFSRKHSINLSGQSSASAADATLSAGSSALVMSDSVPWISVEEKAGGKALAPGVVAAGNQWEVYATADFGQQRLQQIGTMPGMESHLQASTIGFEYRPNDKFAYGLGWAHVWNDNTLAGNLGSADFEGDAIMGYASYFNRNHWADFLYSYGSYDADLRRNTGLGTIVTGAPDQTVHQTSLNMGYNIGSKEKAMVHGPIFNADYSWGGLDAYTEVGDPRAITRYGEQNFESLITRLGWQWTWVEESELGILIPQLRLSYARENLNQNSNVTGVLVNSPFAVGGALGATQATVSPGEGWLELGFGVSWMVKDNVSLFLDYTGQYLREDLGAHFGSVTASVSF